MECGVGGRAAEEELQSECAEGKEEEKVPVGFLRAPLPEVVWSQRSRGSGAEGGGGMGVRRAVVEGDFEKEELDDYHYEALY